MIDATAPTHRITVDVHGRKKLLATVTPTGVQMWCKVLSFAEEISYQKLMEIPLFRAGVLAVLDKERQAP